MTKAELLKILQELENSYDCEVAHLQADEAIIEYINDKEISEAYDKIGKWYA